MVIIGALDIHDRQRDGRKEKNVGRGNGLLQCKSNYNDNGV